MLYSYTFIHFPISYYNYFQIFIILHAVCKEVVGNVDSYAIGEILIVGTRRTGTEEFTYVICHGRYNDILLLNSVQRSRLSKLTRSMPKIGYNVIYREHGNKYNWKRLAISTYKMENLHLHLLTFQKTHTRFSKYGSILCDTIVCLAQYNFHWRYSRFSAKYILYYLLHCSLIGVTSL